MAKKKFSIGKLIVAFTVFAFVMVVVNGVKDADSRENFWLIVSKGDNIPIVFMLFIMAFFVGWAFKEAGRNDNLIDAGRRDEILKDMQR